MAKLNRRRQDILMQIHAEGEVGVEALAAQFGVTTQQIRRDLAALCDQGMAMRTHGGRAVRYRWQTSNMTPAASCR